MVVVTTRRSRSVPPSMVEVNFDYGFGPASRKASRISQYTIDDQEAMRAASRRQDAALLRNITSRMDWTPYFYKPITSYVSHQVRHRAGSEPPVDRVGYTQVYTSPAQRYTTPSVDLAVRNARGALGRLERELSTGWDDPYYRVEDDYVHRPVRPYSVASYDVVSSVPPLRSRARTPTTPRRSRIADIEASLEATYMPETSAAYAGLRSRAADARTKIDMHKTMLDRYLPVNLGPEREVGMPELGRYRPSTPVSSKPVTPYRPAPRSERRMSLPSTPTRVAEKAPPRRPPMSDARKRAREVLCKTKHDPEYFNY